MRSVTRYKAVVIPVIRNRYVVVEDAKYRELTFVVGGCKIREIGTTPDKTAANTSRDRRREFARFRTCAVRELDEETRGVFGKVDPEVLVPAFNFESRNRSKAEEKKDLREGVVVTMKYYVFYLYLDMPSTKFGEIRQKFKRSRRRGREENETKDIFLMSRRELEKAKIWRFMRDYVLRKLK